MASPPDDSTWLRGLLCAKFFSPCAAHEGEKKNECNIFCMRCHVSICQHCVGQHSGHKVLQVRRYVYHDVVRLHDINKLVDCSGVQPYIINSARVVFLNERPQPKPTKSHNLCKTCDRSLQEDFQFCSLGCKVAARCKGHSKGAACVSKAAARLTSQGPCTPAQPSARQTELRSGSASPVPADTHSLDGSSGVSDPDTSSDEDVASSRDHHGDPFLPAPKRCRTSMASSAPHGSPTSVLASLTPDAEPRSPLLHQDSLRSLFRQYEALLTSSKRRKSQPRRSPAY